MNRKILDVVVFGVLLGTAICALTPDLPNWRRNLACFCLGGLLAWLRK